MSPEQEKRGWIKGGLGEVNLLRFRGMSTAAGGGHEYIDSVGRILDPPPRASVRRSFPLFEYDTESSMNLESHFEI